jgi:Glycosyl transferase family 2
MISVVVPTIPGREDHLARVIAAYEATTPDLQLIVEHDHPTCAHAWNAGAARATGDYLHFGADDLVPAAGWWEPAVEAVDLGLMPAPRIVNADGGLDYCGEHGRELTDWRMVQMSVVPFFTAAQWRLIGPCLPIHYYSDNYLSWRAAQAGHPTVVRRGYQFTHWWAQAGRGAGMTYEQRMRHDSQVFHAAVAEAAVR